ncbi:MAG: TonB-dependent receptor [Gammaproteobacteria bacterium]
MKALLVLLAASFCSSAAWAAAPKAHFDIPAGDASETLRRLAQLLAQSKVEILYITSAVRGYQTHAVSGEIDAPTAVHQMLDGTGLDFEFENDDTFVSVKPHAVVEMAEPATPPERLAVASVRNVRADTFEATKRTLGGEPELEEVVITGTLLHGVLDIMSPLTFVTKRELKRSGYATVQDALQALPVNFGGGPSEDFSSVGNFGRGVSANLRGLGSGATLVLVDGRRQPFSGMQGDFVDISNIPWSAVERIEVLPDGASALYGSDAIAGVVNVIMRKDFSGAESQVRFGGAPGGGDEKLISQLWGDSWAGGNFMLSYQYSKRTGLDAASRAYAANADKRALGGTDHRSFNSSPGNILDPFTALPTYGIPGGQNGDSLSVSDLRLDDINRQNRFADYQLLPDRQTHSVYFNGSQKLGEAVELFSEGRYSKRDISQQLFASDRVLLVPSSNPFVVNPYAGMPYVLVGYSFLDDLGPVEIDTATEAFGGTLGLKTRLSEGWRLTVSGSYGRDGTNYFGYNQPDPDLLNTALESTDPETAFNVFGAGTHNSRATLDTIRAVQHERAFSTVTSGTAVADGEALRLPTGAMRLAVGIEWRKEGLAFQAPVAVGFDRSVASAFAELSIPIIGDASDSLATPRLELSLAGRYESYSDFGQTSNPKIGLRFAPSEAVKVRTSWGTSFRAPKLVDVYDTSHNLALLAPLQDPNAESGSSLVLVEQGSNADLRQETATTWTAGLDFAPPGVPGLTMSLTYYAIDYEHRILTPSPGSPFDILLQEAQWSTVIARNPSQAEVNAICDSAVFRGSVDQCKGVPVAAIVDYRVRNLAATRVRGLDLRIDRTLDTQFGKLAFNLNGGYILRFDQAVSDTSSMINIVDTVGNPSSLRLRGTAEWYQHDWDRPGFGASLVVDHTGGYRDTETLVQRGVDSLTTFDVRVGYRTPTGNGFLDSVELGLNAANVFNSSPPFVDREIGYDFQNTEPYGRMLSLTVQKNW